MDKVGYFLDATGQRVGREPGEHDHADIGRRVLKARGIVPADYADIYAQMHRLGYARVVEYRDMKQLHAENDKKPFTRVQMDFLRDRAKETGYEIVLNNRRFTETREGATSSHAQFVAESLLK